MEDDEFAFDFESKLEAQQRSAAAAPAAPPTLPTTAAVPVNQSAKSFQRNYRQTVCTYWLKGVCALGENCGFLHEYNADRMPVCKTLIKFGVCKEPDCPYKHNLEDIKECNMFKLGFCIYGPQCRYRHTKQPGPPPEPATVDAAKPREFRAGGRDAERPEGRRNRDRRGFKGDGHRGGRGGFRQLEGPRAEQGAGKRPRVDGPRPPPGDPPPGGPPPGGAPPGRPPLGGPPMPPGMGGVRGPAMMGGRGPPMPGFMPGMMGGMAMMPGMMPGMMMPGMGMPPFWRGPPMGPRPPPFSPPSSRRS